MTTPGRKLRPSKRTPVPKSVVAAHVTTTVVGSGFPAPTGCVVLSGWAFIHSERVAGKWIERRASSGTSAVSFWSALEEIGNPRNPAYVICPRASVALTLLGWWHHVRSGRYTVWKQPEHTDEHGEVVASGKRRKTHPLIISGTPDIIGYALGDTTYKWVGTRQFGGPTLDLSGPATVGARSVASWFLPLLSAWLDTGCGPWRDSVGAAAWGTYLLRQPKSRVVVHERADAQKIENQACHGGRASIWFTGPVGGKSQWHDYPPTPAYPLMIPSIAGPLHRVDIRGMYPTLMRDKEFPVRLRGVATDWSVERLRASLGGALKIARVKLRTTRPEYPFRRDGRVLYPVGTFITTLAEPELRTAIDAGAVIQVTHVLSYERGNPFREWGEWVIGLRKRAAARNVPGWSSYIKHVSVALSGKLATEPGGWQPKPDVCPRVEWGEWWRTHAETGVERHFRSLGGHTHEWEKRGLRPGCLAACYAFLTAYGRDEMRRLRQVCGVRQVIAQHTDGLIVRSKGLEALRAAGEIDGEAYGKLRVEGAYQTAWFRGPNHWWADGSWTVAGVAGGYTVDERGIVRETVTIEPARSGRDPTGQMVYDRIRTVDPAMINCGDRFDENGWVVPPRVGQTRGPSDTPTLLDTDQT